MFRKLQVKIFNEKCELKIIFMFFTRNISIVFQFHSVAVTNTMITYNLGAERVYFSLQFIVHLWRKAGQNLKQKLWRYVAFRLGHRLVCFQRTLYIPRPPAEGWCWTLLHQWKIKTTPHRQPCGQCDLGNLAFETPFSGHLWLCKVNC